MQPSNPPQTWEPGSLVERVLEKLPEWERPGNLAFMEQEARRLANLDVLREIRAYKAKHNL